MDHNDTTLRVRAIEGLLVEKGLVQAAALAAIVDKCETKIEPHNGVAVVVGVWANPAFKTQLLADATAAIAELRFSGA